MTHTRYFSVEYLDKEESSEVPGSMRICQILKFLDHVCLAIDEANMLMSYIVRNC